MQSVSELRTKQFSTPANLLPRGYWQCAETVLVVPISTWWVKLRDATKHPTMYGTQNYPAPNANRAEVESQANQG